MAETRKVFKWWWPWQTDSVENMLEDNAAQGWMLVHANGACTSFVFEKREPAKIRYCIDYQEKEKPEYLALLCDDGWKKEYRSSGWYIWSKAYDAERPSLFTDVDSLVRRNIMILGSLTAVFAAQIPLFVVNMDNIGKSSPVVTAFFILWGLIVAVLAGMAVGMALGINKLKRRKDSARN